MEMIRDDCNSCFHMELRKLRWRRPQHPLQSWAQLPDALVISSAWGCMRGDLQDFHDVIFPLCFQGCCTTWAPKCIKSTFSSVVFPLTFCIRNFF